MAQRQVHSGEDGSGTARDRSIVSRRPWSRKRALRRNMDRARQAKARKQIPSMQESSLIGVSGSVDVPQVAAQPTNHAASTEQPRPAANVEQSCPPATDQQQPGPSRLSAADPEQTSTTFPQWSESDSDEHEYTYNSEDEILLGLGMSSSSSDETESSESDSDGTTSDDLADDEACALLDGWVEGLDRQRKRQMTIILVRLLLATGMGKLAAYKQAAEAFHVGYSTVRKQYTYFCKHGDRAAQDHRGSYQRTNHAIESEGKQHHGSVKRTPGPGDIPCQEVTKSARSSLRMTQADKGRTDHSS